MTISGLEMGQVNAAETPDKKDRARKFQIHEQYISPLIVSDWEASKKIIKGETPEGVTPAPVQERFRYNPEESDEKLKEYKLDIWREACTLPEQQKNFEQALAQLEDDSHPLTQELYQVQQTENVEGDTENKAKQELLRKDIEYLRGRLESLIAGCKKRLEAMSSEAKWQEVGEQFYKAYRAFKDAGKEEIEKIKRREAIVELPKPGEKLKLGQLPEHIRALSAEAQRLALPPYTDLYLKEKYPDMYSELYERK